MRPPILLAPVTLAIAESWRSILGADSVTVDADTSATVRRWPAARRPVTRANVGRAVALALLQSSDPAARKLANDAASGDRKACIAIALAVPSCWECPDKLPALVLAGAMGSRAIPRYDMEAQRAVMLGASLSADYCEEHAPAGRMWCSQHGDDNAPAPAPILAQSPARPAEWFRKALLLDAPAPTPASAKPAKGKRNAKGKPTPA